MLDTADARVIIVDSFNVRTTLTMVQYLTTFMYKKFIYAIILPRLGNATVFRTYKIMVRAQNAHAYVNAGFSISFSANRVASARICYGGINPDFTHAFDTEAMLEGNELYTNEQLQWAIRTLQNELRADWVLPDAQPEYREQLAIALFYRFVLATCPPEMVSTLNRSGGAPIVRPLSSGTQKYVSNQTEWPLGQAVNKYEGLLQASGEAKFINDLPPMKDELWAAFAVAKQANTIVVQIDTKEAMVSARTNPFDLRIKYGWI